MLSLSGVFTKKVRREVLVGSLFFLSESRRRHLERWVRGREEQRRLRAGDVSVVSCGKSGETWLRTLVSRFFQLRFDLDTSLLLNLDNYHRDCPEIPRVNFTHDGYLPYYTGNFTDKFEYRSKPVIGLVRHPADVAVSQYFQWKHRMRPRKKWLNEYPQHGSDASMFDLVMDKNAGMPNVIDFLNVWNRERRLAPHLEVVRYEDLLFDTAAELVRVLAVMGFAAAPQELAECVRFGSFDNMRKLEERGVFRRSGRSLRRVSPTTDENAFKVRRGKAGGWRDYFDAEEAAAIEGEIDARLDPGLGYRSGEGGRMRRLTPRPLHLHVAG